MNIKLELSDAQASWKFGENWTVHTPGGETLFHFKGKHDEKTAMEAIHLGRVFELKAFNIGIEYGKEIQKKSTKNDIAKLEVDNIRLAQENQRLAEQLKRHINK